VRRGLNHISHASFVNVIEIGILNNEFSILNFEIDITPALEIAAASFLKRD